MPFASKWASCRGCKRSQREAELLNSLTTSDPKVAADAKEVSVRREIADRIETVTVPLPRMQKKSA